MERARRDVAAGELWKARDRLVGALAHRADDEFLGLLGEVRFAMGDLPAAGAAWFAIGRTDAEGVAADEAWRRRHGGNAEQLWFSLAPTIRKRPDTVIHDLRAAAAAVAQDRSRSHPNQLVPPPSSGVGCELLVLLFVVSLAVLCVIGVLTVLRWLL